MSKKRRTPRVWAVGLLPCFVQYCRHVKKAHGALSFVIFIAALVLPRVNRQFMQRRGVISRPQSVIQMNNMIQSSPTYGTCYKGRSMFPGRSKFCQRGKVPPRHLSMMETRKSDHIAPVPNISVVMPFHDHGMLTCQSLQELVLQSEDLDLELVLVDDASTSRESLLVSKCATRLSKTFSMPHEILRNNVSLGYGRSCSLGAAHATGTLLLFANNDMFMGIGSLFALVKTLTEYPSAGIVGPLFLGHEAIEEYGGNIYNDASAANGLRGKSSIPPRLLMAHEVDYISAACILLAREVFHNLGGFGSEFGRGYYEDTDLAMMVRRAKMKVIVQPSAVVFHQEGSTFGSDSTEKQHLMKVNRNIFHEKWRRELQGFTNPDASLLQVREKYMANPLLWIDQTFITPSHDSGSQRSWNIISHLQRRRFQVEFLSMSSYAEEDIMLSLGLMRFHGIRVLTNVSRTLCGDGSKECRYKVIFISRPQTMKSIWQILNNACCKGVPIVYDTVDLHFLREARQVLENVKNANTVSQILSMVHCGAYQAPETLSACLDQLPNKQAIQAMRKHTRRIHALMKQETFSMRVANVSLMLSSVEKDIAISLGIASEKLHIVSNIYADADIDHAFDSLRMRMEQSHSKEKNGAIFVGSMQHVPNISALKELIKITDRICKHYPKFIMHIVGSHPSYVPEAIMVQLRNHNRIRFHGWVSDEDLKLLYEKCVASFVPLVSGAGVKGKVASAYLHGVPVVATEVAVEGMGLSRQSCILAHDPDEYLNAYKLLKSNVGLGNQMATAGLVVLRERFSMSAAASALDDVLKAVAPSNRYYNASNTLLLTPPVHSCDMV